METLIRGGGIILISSICDMKRERNLNSLLKHVVFEIGSPEKKKNGIVLSQSLCVGGHSGYPRGCTSSENVSFS